MQLTFRQWMRLLIAIPIVAVWLLMFFVFGWDLRGVEQAELASTVTAYATYLTITGAIVVVVINFLFNDDRNGAGQ